MSARKLFYVILGAILAAAIIIGFAVRLNRSYSDMSNATEEARRVLGH